MHTSDLLIPVRKSRPGKGVFTWPERPTLASVRSADMLPLGQLDADLRKLSLKRARIVRDALSPADVRIRRDTAIRGRDAYRLTIAPEGIEILASTDAGAYYALQTLRDLVAAEGSQLRACRIDDWPDFQRRGVYEDCSRGKVPTVQTVKELVVRLAHWKVNEFQLYVENVFTFKRHPAIGRGYSPFTPEDILEIQDFCKLHHVTFVGSLTSFGHMGKILKLPQYIHLAELPGHLGQKGGTTLCPTDPGSIKLVADMFEEFVPLFEAEDFNICCDETWELGQGRSKPRADKIGDGRLYLEFLLKIYKLCEKHGKRANAWGDIILNHPELLAEVPKDMVMLNWGYSATSKRIGQTPMLAKAGAAFMVCPGTSSWKTHGTELPNAIANVANFVAKGRSCGAEGVLNTDWGDHLHRNFLGVSMHGFAHGAAHCWHGRAVDDATFTERFCRRVFGQTTTKLANSIRTIGGASGPRNRYHALVEPLARPPKRPDRVFVIDRTDPAGLGKIISQLSRPQLWPELPKSAERFEKFAIAEYALAARMDCLAGQRILTAQKLRAGKAVPAAELRALADETHRMSRDFAKLWLARNRQSRLADNLKLFSQTEREARRLAKR